jgi:hypothetical protein
MASNMAVQIKLFYNIGFEEDKCQVIFVKGENLPNNFEELLEITREKIESLRFVPNSEVRIQYYDDEGTLVHLREDEPLNEAWRCSKHVTGTEFRRVKIRITWQPKTTPELFFVKTAGNGDEGKHWYVKKEIEFW